MLAPAYRPSFVRRDEQLDQNAQVFGVEAGTNPNYPFANVAPPPSRPAIPANLACAVSSGIGFAVVDPRFLLR